MEFPKLRSGIPIWNSIERLIWARLSKLGILEGILASTTLNS